MCLIDHWVPFRETTWLQRPFSEKCFFLIVKRSIENKLKLKRSSRRSITCLMSANNLNFYNGLSNLGGKHSFEYVHIIWMWFSLVKFCLKIQYFMEVRTQGRECVCERSRGTEGGEASPCPFLKIEKKDCSDLRKKSPDCIHLWVKCLI